MNYSMETMEPQSTVYMRRTGAYGSGNYDLMAAFKNWVTQKGYFKDSTIYGIAHDGPGTPPDQCRYDVCLGVDLDCRDDNRVLSGEIPGGIYAVFTVAHTAQAVQEFWGNLFPVLQQNGLALDVARPILERYRQDIMEAGYCEFCVPLVHPRM